MKRATATLSQIAEHVQGRLLDIEAGSLVIQEVRGLQEADERSLSYCDDPRAVESAATGTGAAALLVPDSTETCCRPAIAVRNPRLAFSRALALLNPQARPSSLRHRTAQIPSSAHVDPSAHIGPYCSIGEHAHIGRDVVLRGHVRVGERSVIGDGTELRPRVVVGDDVTIGSRCLLHAGGVIGEPRTSPSPVPTVLIGDDVEMGSRVRVEAGRDATTTVGRGTKTDNLVRIGADAVLGEGCLMVSCSQVAPAARLDHHVTLAGQAMVLEGVQVGAMAIVGARGKVDRDLAPRTMVSGDPAVPHKEELRRVANALKLARLVPTLCSTMEAAEQAQ